MSLFLKAEHMLQGGYFHVTLRHLQQPNTDVRTHNLMYPVFIVDEDEAVEEIASMPAVHRFGINKIKGHLEPLVAKGLKSVLLFGVTSNLSKDESGTNADSDRNPIVRVLPLLRNWFPNLLIACDVCLCPYTSHGHCGILQPNGTINHSKSVKRIAEIAFSYAKSGAHIVAPSDMMDNRIKAIKEILVENGLQNQVSVLSYSCKFASSLYGPFRDAAKSSPASGDRKCYQLPPGSAGLAARAAERDVAEGADMLMVKPALAYLDIVRQTKDKFPNHPLFVYQVSGEYSMLYHSRHSSDFQAILFEVLTSMRRAGADCIITYFTPYILECLQKTHL